MDIWLLTGVDALADMVAGALAGISDLHLRRSDAAGGSGVLLVGYDCAEAVGQSALPTLLLARQLDPDQVRAAYRAGAVDCLLVPDELPSLVAAIRTAGHAQGGGGRLIAVHSAKGGSGKTVIAANLAVALQTQCGLRTLLVDLNLQVGGAEILLALEPERSLVHLLPVVAELDSDHLARVAVSHQSGLMVLCSPADLEAAGRVTADKVRSLLIGCRRLFDAVVVDCPSHLDENTQAVLALADPVLLIATPDALSIPPLQRALGQLESRGVLDRRRVRLVVNRVSGSTDVQPADLSSLSGLPLAGTVRSDFRHLQPVVNRGRSLVTAGVALARDIAALARAVAG